MAVSIYAYVVVEKPITAFVVVELTVETLIKLDVVANKVSITALLAAKLTVKKLVDEELTITEEEAKIFTTNKSLNLANNDPKENSLSKLGTISPDVVVAVIFKLFIVELLKTKLVIVALLDTKLLIVPEATVKLVDDAVITFRSVIVVVASIVVPVAVKLPVTKLDVVAFSATRLLKNDENDEKIFALKFVDVA